MRGECQWFRDEVSLREGSVEDLVLLHERGFPRSHVREVVGEFMFRRTVRQLAVSGARRRWLVQQTRPIVWRLRMWRSYTSHETTEALKELLEFGDFLVAAGVSPDTWQRYLCCACTGCGCVGCDLWDGQRFENPLPC